MRLCLHVPIASGIPLISRVLPRLFTTCLLIHPAVAAPFHTALTEKHTNFTVIAFTGQQKPEETTFPSLCSLSCLFVTICSCLTYTQRHSPPAAESTILLGICAAPSPTIGSWAAMLPAPCLPSRTRTMHMQAPKMFSLIFLVKVQTVRGLKKRIFSSWYPDAAIGLTCKGSLQIVRKVNRGLVFCE